MKITKRQLRRIVKEEKQNILEERLLREGVRRCLIESNGRLNEGFFDKLKKLTGLGRSDNTDNLIKSMYGIKTQYQQFIEDYMPSPEDLKLYVDYIQSKKRGGGFTQDDPRSKMPKSKQKALGSQGPADLTKALKGMRKALDAIEADIPSSAKDKTVKKARSYFDNLEAAILQSSDFFKQLPKTYARAIKRGDSQAFEDLLKQQHQEHKAKMAAIEKNVKDAAMANKANRDAEKSRRRKDDLDKRTGDYQSSEKFGKATNI